MLNQAKINNADAQLRVDKFGDGNFQIQFCPYQKGECCGPRCPKFKLSSPFEDKLEDWKDHTTCQRVYTCGGEFYRILEDDA